MPTRVVGVVFNHVAARYDAANLVDCDHSIRARHLCNDMWDERGRQIGRGRLSHPLDYNASDSTMRFRLRTQSWMPGQ
jgi:hypothetical protein